MLVSSVASMGTISLIDLLYLYYLEIVPMKYFTLYLLFAPWDLSESTFGLHCKAQLSTQSCSKFWVLISVALYFTEFGASLGK